MERAGRALDLCWAGLGRALPTGAPDGRPYPGPRLVTLWLLTRTFTLVVLVLTPLLWSDLGYYVRALNGGLDGVPEGLLEYPLPAVWLLALPDLVSQGDVSVYPVLAIAAFVVVDAAFTLFLHRATGPNAVRLWLAAAPLVGPLLYTRFDILTGTAVAVAVLVVVRRPRTAALLLAAAAALKLWPAVLLPALASVGGVRRRVLTTALAAAVLLGGAMLALGGPDRVLSPLRYQADRGLQVESLVALPLMGAWAAVHEPWTVFYSAFRAMEVDGPGAAVLASVSTAATMAALVLVAVVAVRLWRSTDPAPPLAVAWAVLSAATTLVVASKVFSPQYLIWLVPLAIAVVALDGRRTAVRCAVALLLAGVLGQLIYPVLYDVVRLPGTWNLLGTALLALRLVPIVAVAAVATREAWRLSAATAVQQA